MADQAVMSKMSPEFQQAVEDGRHLTSKPTNEDLLEAYGLFKQATQDPPIEKSEKPGMFDLKAKAKRNAWQKIIDDGYADPKKAEARYVEHIAGMKESYGYDATKEPEPIGGK